jgi:hypothetical protein
MYGPPPNCKRKMRGTGLVCANVYGLDWSEKTPGHDGMRYALFPFTTAVLEDFGRVRVLRAPDLTVVPSRCSPANLAGNHKFLSCRQSGSSSSRQGSPIGFPGGQHRPGHSRQFIG